MDKELPTVHVPPDATVWNAEAVRNLLLEALKGADGVAVALGATNNVDVTFLQTLLSAHRYAKEKGKSLTFPGGKHSGVMELARLTGFATPPDAAGGWPW